MRNRGLDERKAKPKEKNKKVCGVHSEPSLYRRPLTNTYWLFAISLELLVRMSGAKAGLVPSEKWCREEGGGGR